MKYASFHAYEVLPTEDLHYQQSELHSATELTQAADHEALTDTVDADLPVDSELLWEEAGRESSVLRKQMTAAPLLTAEQETQLALTIRRGRHAADRLGRLGYTTLLDSVEREQLTAEITAARKARDQFIMSNVRLVYSLAHKYMDQGIEPDDLIQAGITGGIGAEGELLAGGLFRAVDKFDPDEGVKFSTYAAYWINQAFQRVIAIHRSPIRVPSQINEDLMSIAAAEVELSKRLQRPPRSHEIAREAGMQRSKLRELLGIRAAYWTKGAVYSTDSVMDNEEVGGQTFGETIGDAADNPDSELAFDAIYARHILGQLPGRQAYLIRQLTGFEVGEPLSEAEIVNNIGAGYTVPLLRRDLLQACQRVTFIDGQASQSEDQADHWLVAYARRHLEPPTKLETHIKELSVERLFSEPTMIVALERAMLTVSSRARHVLQLLYGDGLSVNEVTLRTGDSKPVVRRLAKSGITKLIENARLIAEGNFDFADWERRSVNNPPTVPGLLTRLGVPIADTSRLSELEAQATALISGSGKLSATEKAALLYKYGLHKDLIPNEHVQARLDNYKRMSETLGRLAIELEQPRG